MHERQFALIMFVRMESHVLIVLYDTNDVDTSDIVETVIQSEAHFFVLYI